MSIHHEKTLTRVFATATKQLSKKDAFSAAFSRTKGAAKRTKLNKAWEKLLTGKTIQRTPSKRYSMAI